ncbi:MAG: DUF4089 domain-containing protein [Rhodobacteraceae bacterium]|jgi:hypothetical protein|nr:DUF4089 domain-containing protein [Paracoccaceae bacterium]
MHRPAFPPPPAGFDAAAYARAAAAAVGLPLPEEAVAEVAANLARTAGFARLVAAAPGLAGEAPAPVFTPKEAPA